MCPMSRDLRLTAEGQGTPKPSLAVFLSTDDIKAGLASYFRSMYSLVVHLRKVFGKVMLKICFNCI